jgi:hypothetical protein
MIFSHALQKEDATPTEIPVSPDKPLDISIPILIPTARHLSSLLLCCSTKDSNPRKEVSLLIKREKKNTSPIEI